MSRIDQALRRAPGVPDSPAAPDSQEPFSPAWSDSQEGQAPAAIGPTPAGSGAALREARPVKPALPPTPTSSVGLVRFSKHWQERLATGANCDPALVEQFRRLAVTLHHAHENNDLRSVMITSAEPNDGKTLTAVNLAIVLAESYRYRVLLVDADLRRPSIPNVVELGDGGGLSEVLRATTDQKLALVSLTPNLTLLPAGQPTSNSIEALTSPRMKRIMDEAEQRFDWIIMDAPPVGPAADAHLLAQMVGGVLFVVRAEKTPSAAVDAAIKGIGRERILGVVLNGVTETAKHYYYAPNSPDSNSV